MDWCGIGLFNKLITGFMDKGEKNVRNLSIRDIRRAIIDHDISIGFIDYEPYRKLMQKRYNELFNWN